MSAAPSWPLVIVALFRGEPSKARFAAAPGFEFSSVFGSEAQFQGAQVLNLFFIPSKRKTTRGALDRTRPSDRSHCGLQKPEIAYSPNDLMRQRRRPSPSRVFVLPPRYGVTIVEIRGSSPRIPTNFRVRPAPRHSFCKPSYGRPGKSAKRVFTQMAGLPRVLATRSRVSLRSPGMELKQASLTSIPPSRQPSRAGP